MQNPERKKKEKLERSTKFWAGGALEGKSHIINQGMHKIILKWVLKERDVRA